MQVLNKISRINALTRLVILDGLRRHALIGLTLFALAIISGGLLFFDFIPRDIGRASNDFIFSVIWLTGFIFLLFHGVPTLSWDNERGALHIFMARPISRTEYAIALYVGLSFLLLALNITLSTLGWGMLNFIKGSVAEMYFRQLSLSFFILTGIGLYTIQLMILSVIILLSSAIRGSFPVLLLTLCYYLTCTGLPVVRQTITSAHTPDTNSSLPTLLKILTGIFPDFSWFDFKTLVVASDHLPILPQIVLSFFLAAFYIVIILSTACLIYEQRDLQ
jgi:Cu-processing system permease protein